MRMERGGFTDYRVTLLRLDSKARGNSNTVI
jgi:hypothetical protein